MSNKELVDWVRSDPFDDGRVEDARPPDWLSNYVGYPRLDQPVGNQDFPFDQDDFPDVVRLDEFAHIDLAEKEVQPTLDHLKHEVVRGGIEALAFYVPFHSTADSWGIFIRQSGLEYLANRLSGGARLQKKHIVGAHQILYGHELFHARCEFASTNMEMAVQKPIYPAYFKNRLVDPIEESAGNAVGLRFLGDESMVAYAKYFMSDQPTQYRDFNNYLPSLRRAMRPLTRHMLEHAGTNVLSPTGPIQNLWPGTGASLKSVVPVYMIIDGGESMVSVARLFPAYEGLLVKVHSNDHDPIHFHLEDPVGKARGKYKWEDAAPADKGVKRLSNREMRRLNLYMDRFAGRIRARLETNYPDHAPLPEYSGY